jgi:hypothetical protein
MMGTVSTISSVFLLAALGSSSTNAPLPYQYNPLEITVIGNYREIKEYNEKYSTSIRDESQLQIIVNVSKHLIMNSKSIDNEFVEIVNKNFWDLV